MGIVYPSLKPMLEASIRKLSVSVKWKEGPNNREVLLVQYITNPQRAGFAEGIDGGTGAFGTAPGTTGSPASTGGTPGGVTR
jgi:hypothetical protein